MALLGDISTGLELLRSPRELPAMIVALAVGVALLLVARSAIQSVMVLPPGVAYPSLTLVAGSSAALLLAVLIIACYRPIVAAARTDLTVSLRVE